MKKLGRFFLSLILMVLIVGTAMAAPPIGRIQAVLTFTPSAPTSSWYFVEMKQNNNWRKVAIGSRSPIIFIVGNLPPGIYTVRLNGQISNRITTLSNEMNFTIPNQSHNTQPPNNGHNNNSNNGHSRN